MASVNSLNQGETVPEITIHFTVFQLKLDAEKTFCLARGPEWIGGDTFDDYC